MFAFNAKQTAGDLRVRFWPNWNICRVGAMQSIASIDVLTENGYLPLPVSRISTLRTSSATLLASMRSMIQAR